MTYFSHSKVTGLSQWTYMRDVEQAMCSYDGAIKLNALVWFYVHRMRYNTDETRITDASGRATVRGFKGLYDITVQTADGTSKAFEVEVLEDSTVQLAMDGSTSLTSGPSSMPTSGPTQPSPTKAPTGSPNEPTNNPTTSPSRSPSAKPVAGSPTGSPIQPTNNPSASPTKAPTGSPNEPTGIPTKSPSGSSTQAPTTGPTPYCSQYTNGGVCKDDPCCDWDKGKCFEIPC